MLLSLALLMFLNIFTYLLPFSYRKASNEILGIHLITRKKFIKIFLRIATVKISLIYKNILKLIIY